MSPAEPARSRRNRAGLASAGVAPAEPAGAAPASGTRARVVLTRFGWMGEISR
jgi:hypothetical protein